VHRGPFCGELGEASLVRKFGPAVQTGRMFMTIRESMLLLLLLGTTISTGPISVSTVLGQVPVRK
jgi:hypothetical protein